MKPRKLIKKFFLFTSAMQFGYYAVVYADKYKEDIKRVIKKS